MYRQNNYFRMNNYNQPKTNEVRIPHSQLINTLHDCVATCYYTMSEVLGMSNVSNREMQIKMLHDCARICESQATYTAMNSTFAKQHADMCAMVCEECAKHCAKHNDLVSQNCAAVCMRCAAECRQYAKMM